jgi:hypothetical protein
VKGGSFDVGGMRDLRAGLGGGPSASVSCGRPMTAALAASGDDAMSGP